MVNLIPARTTNPKSENSMSVLKIGRAQYLGLTGFCALAIVGGFYAVVATANETSRAPVNVSATVLAIAGVLVLVAACVALFVVGV